MFSLWYFSLYSIGAHVLVCAVYVLHICFSKQKSSSSKQWFHWRILRGIFPVKTTRKWRHLFVWILLHCNFFVIHYIFWLKIAVRHETLSMKTVFISRLRNHIYIYTCILRFKVISRFWIEILIGSVVSRSRLYP